MTNTHFTCIGRSHGAPAIPATKEDWEKLKGKPFKDNITEFRERVEKIYASENTERGSLRQELKQLMELNRTITEQTNNLTTALRSNSKVQGDFGELILKTILDRSNLEEGIHYSVQKSFKGDEGNNFRPDIVLNLPDGKRIVIDSKMTLTAHADMIEAKDSNKRQEALKNLIKSVQSHIKELSRLLDGIKCRINLIRFHKIPDSPFFSPELEKIIEFRDTLTKRGIQTTLRASRGEDIEAACGLLSTAEKK